MSVRVLVFAQIKPGHEADFESGWALLDRDVAKTPGYIRSELLRRSDRPSTYILLSEWESREAFLAWEDRPVHRGTTTPIRPYWDGMPERVIYDIAVEERGQPDSES